MLRERPPVPCVVPGRVHPLSERHVGRRIHNVGAALLCVLVVLVDVINRDEYVCGDLGSLRCPVRSALTTKHDGCLGDRELRMAGHTVAFCTEALGEAERPAEPLDRLTDILVDQDRHYSRSWGRAVLHNSCFHFLLPEFCAAQRWPSAAARDQQRRLRNEGTWNITSFKFRTIKINNVELFVEGLPLHSVYLFNIR